MSNIEILCLIIKIVVCIGIIGTIFYFFLLLISRDDTGDIGGYQSRKGKDNHVAPKGGTGQSQGRCVVPDMPRKIPPPPLKSGLLPHPRQ